MPIFLHGTRMLLVLATAPLMGFLFAASRHFATSPLTPTPAGQEFSQGLPESKGVFFTGKIPKAATSFYVDHFFPLDGAGAQPKIEGLPLTRAGGRHLNISKGYTASLPASEQDDYL